MQTHNSPLKAIREKCLECSCGQAYEKNAVKTDLESNDKEIGGEE